jgi:transcriptional regulator with XRE-family HTH domain
MEIKDRMIQIRKEKGLKLKDIQDKLISIFGKKEALSYRTLLRAEKGQHEERDSSIYQICIGLGVSLEEFTKGLVVEVGDAKYIKHNNRRNKSIFNETAFADVLTPKTRKMSAIELILSPKGKTGILQDIGEKGKFEKFVYGVKGRIDCIIEEKKFSLRKGDCLSFDSTFPHYFENRGTKKNRCLVIYNQGNVR